MRKFLLYIMMACLSALPALAQTEGYDPSNPPDPTVPGGEEQVTRYHLTVSASPYAQNCVNSTGGDYQEGYEIYLYAYSRDHMTFMHWVDEEGTILATSRSLYYKMPARDARVTAVYKYDPANPADPEVMPSTKQYTLTLVANPVAGGSFSPNSTVLLREGEETSIYAYTNTFFRFLRWENEAGDTLSLSRNFYYQMPAADTKLIAYYEYVPGNPQNPGKNAYDATTGEVIVDDFTPGSLSDAVYNAVNGNSEGVTQIIVAGRMNSNDFSIANNYYQCTLVDFSRTAGVSEVPSWCYSGNNYLTQIILPASITHIGYRAFYNATALASITCYAATPPTVDAYVFDGIPEGLVVYVPEKSIELYEQADGWKDFIILPIQGNIHNVELNLPDECADGRYKNMALELVNIKSGQKYKYVVTDRIHYTFSNLMKNTTYNAYLKTPTGVVLAQLDSIKVSDSDQSLTFHDILTLRSAQARVVLPTGEDVTGQVNLAWYDEKDVLLGTEAFLPAMVEGQHVRLAASLPQTLGLAYLQPAAADWTITNGENVVTVELAAYPQSQLSGRAIDRQTQEPIARATVTVAQTLNGKFDKAFTLKTDAQGRFALDVFAAPTKVTLAEAEHVSLTLEVSDTLLLQGPADLADLALKPITGATIATQFTFAESVEAGQQVEPKAGYSDPQNIAYTIYNVTQQRNITQFSVQYPKLVLLEEVNEGDVLRITASSKNRAFQAVTVETTLDEALRAEAAFPLVQLGGISANFGQTENSAVCAMLYDASGAFVKKSSYETAKLLLTGLDDGTYTLVSMGESDFFNAINHLSAFREAGLTEGIDYVKNSVTVKSGELAVVKNALIPYFDESKLYYTGENTSFTSNKASVVVGNYLTFTLKADFKEVYASQVGDITVMIDLPQELSYVSNSMMVGSQLVGCDVNGQRLEVAVPGIADLQRIRFCAVPTRSGDYAPTAYLKFNLAGHEVTQPVGSAPYTAQEMSVNIPSVLGKAEFTVSGTATGRASVELYDGIDLIGSTTALANGLWSVKCALVDPQPFSLHNIYARIVSKDGVEMQTETYSVSYNPYNLQVVKVQMINTAHPATSLDLKDYVTEFDFQNPSLEKKTYWYWPSYPDFTFLAELSSNDTTIIDRVFINAFLEDGNVVSLPAHYNKTKDRWVATSQFHTGHLPINVSVTIDDCQYNLADTLQYKLITDEILGTLDFRVDKQTEDSLVTDIFDEDGNFVERVEITKNPGTVDEVLDNLEKEGYVPEMVTDSLILVQDTIRGNSAYVLIESDPIIVVKVNVLTEYWSRTILESVDTVLMHPWRNKIDEKRDCASGTLTQIFEEGYTYMERYNWLRLTHYVLDTYLTKQLPLTDFVIDSERVFRLIVNIRRHFHTYYSDRVTTSMETIIKAINCGGTPPPPPPTDGSSDYVMDPSGYVYEAIESNRLEGVRATVYYKETVEDMYGDLHENIVLWDAEEYAQKNPLFTDENGMYQWDVPQGLWQVKFEKEGYQTTYSDWLPVPPPQLEVNIGMVQNAQPEVVKANAYDDGVELEFSKYMKPESLTAENLYLKLITGSEEVYVKDAAIELLNAEAVSEAGGETFASKVAIKPTQDLGLADEVYVIVNSRVQSYAGIPMADAFTQKLDIEKKVRSIETEETYNVGYEQSMQVLVGALPVDASKGKVLAVKTASDLIATISAEGAEYDDQGRMLLTLDENGQTSFMLNGELLGTTGLSFSVLETDARAAAAVNVVDPAKLNAVKSALASRISGTEIYRGQTVTLSCESEGATIYYTLDGSCPCDAGRIKYEGRPIAINNDLTLKVMAVGLNGSESEVKEYVYTIKQTNLQLSLAEGWNWTSHNLARSLEVSDFEADYVNRLLTQQAEVVNDPVLGFVGNLSAVRASQALKVETQGATTMQLSGEQYNPTSEQISLHTGWNWLGYPLAQTMSLAEAFAHLDVEEGDVVSNLEGGYAEYTSDGWMGDLQTMVPGKGYLYKSASDKSFVYNDAIVSRAKALYSERLTLDVAPWTTDTHAYPSMMCLTATLFDGGFEADPNDFFLAAFAQDNVCRGVAKPVGDRYFLSVYGQEETPIRFVAVHKATGVAYDVSESLSFTPDVVGSVSQPFALNLGEATGLLQPGFANGQTDGIFNVAGQQLRKATQPGVYIVNGKKVIINKQ